MQEAQEDSGHAASGQQQDTQQQEQKDDTKEQKASKRGTVIQLNVPSTKVRHATMQTAACLLGLCASPGAL
jgi:hypothetical protein